MSVPGRVVTVQGRERALAAEAVRDDAAAPRRARALLRPALPVREARPARRARVLAAARWRTPARSPSPTASCCSTRPRQRRASGEHLRRASRRTSSPTCGSATCDHGVVGRPVAQRVVRVVDGRQGRATRPSPSSASGRRARRTISRAMPDRRPAHHARDPPAGRRRSRTSHQAGRRARLRQGPGRARHVRALDRARGLPHGRPRLPAAHAWGNADGGRPVERAREGLGQGRRRAHGDVPRPARRAARVSVELAGRRARSGSRRAASSTTASRAPAAACGRFPVTLCATVDGKQRLHPSSCSTRAEADGDARAAARPAWVHPNADESGYYRWSLPPARSASWPPRVTAHAARSASASFSTPPRCSTPG